MREKQQHIYSTTNQPGTSSFLFSFLFWLAKNILCMLTNSLKWKAKENSIKGNSTQHVNYCTRERLEVLRQCKSIAPIQIMHSMGNENKVCWCRAHGLRLPPVWWKRECWYQDKSTRGLGINTWLLATQLWGEKGLIVSAFYSDFISVLKGRSLCHFFMCFSKVL